MEGSVAFSGTLIGGITGGGEGTNNYNDLINKPSINGIPLSGNKTSSDLHLFTGDYSDLSNKPTINGVTVEGSLTSADLNMFDGDYDHLTNKPTLFSGDYPDLTNKPTINGNTLVGNKTTSDLGLFSGNYNDLTNKPTLFSGDYDDLTDKPRINNHTLSGDMSSADLDIFSGDYDDLTNKPTLFSGDYNDLTNKPTIPVIEFNPVAAAVDEVDKASLNGVVYDIKDSAARSDVMLAIDNAAAAYDPEGEYLVGDYCTHDGIMYQCNTDIASPGEEWDPTHWDVTDCGIELNEIKQSLSQLLQWTLVDTKTGSTSINLPANFNELLCVANVDNSGNKWSCVIPKNELSSTASYFRVGNYSFSNSNGTATIQVSLSSAKMYQLYWNETDKLSTSTFTVYYR